jgi:hypothetical protein
MPLKSNSQRKLMFATINGKDTGVPKKVAEDFIKKTPEATFSKLKKKITFK